MSNKLIIIITFLLFSIIGEAQIPKGYFHYAQFKAIDGTTYLETYLAIAGNSVTYVPIEPEKEEEQASVEITMVFKNADVVKAFRKYNLKSPKSKVTLRTMPDFIDLQRISLPNGTYNFELKLKDNYADSAVVFTYNDLITIDFDSTDIAFSGVELAESFRQVENRSVYTKNGFDIVPYVSNFYPENINSLAFYLEIYNVDKQIGRDSSFLVNTYIEGSPTRKRYTQFMSFDRKKAAPINLVFKNIDITKLNTGNYNLVIEVRDKNNKVLARKVKFFQRLNKQFYQLASDYSNIDVSKTFADKYTDVKKLADLLYAVYPIAAQSERKYILQNFTQKDLETMQRFFYNFWQERNPRQPEKEWLKYKHQLRVVQNAFGYGARRGYATDLGRIYLKYGPPNSIKEERLGQTKLMSEGGQDAQPVDAVEYQIWHYYKVNGQFDRIFVFVKGLGNLSLGNEYVLLYSDVAGETGYSSGLNFTDVNSLINNIDSKMLRDIQNESSRALTRFLSGNGK